MVNRILLSGFDRVMSTSLASSNQPSQIIQIQFLDPLTSAIEYRCIFAICCFCTIGTTLGKYTEFLAIRYIEQLPEKSPFGQRLFLYFFEFWCIFLTFGTRRIKNNIDHGTKSKSRKGLAQHTEKQ